MNLASAFGVSLSENLVGANPTNLRGAFEDVDILRTSRAILRHFHRDGAALSYLPLPKDWLSDDFVLAASNQLKKLVDCELQAGGVWGFKEPVTAKLLPLWKGIFDELGVEPIYLLSLRCPKGVAASFYKAYKVPPRVSELVWLSRYADAVLNTSAGFDIFEYERWFDEPVHNVDRLLNCVGLGSFEEGDKQRIISTVLDPAIRTVDALGGYEVMAITARFYEALQDYSVSGEGRERLISIAEEVSAYLAGLEEVEYAVRSMGGKLDSALGKLSEERLRVARPQEYVLNKRKVSFCDSHKVVAGVASFEARRGVFEKSVLSIYDQVDHIYVYLNGYADVPAYLISDKITVFRSQDYADLSANGKVFSLGEVGSCYFFSLDDDILYPDDYVEKMISCMEKYENKVAACVHGSVLPDRPEWYYERYSLFPFQSEQEVDRFVNLIGSGTLAFHTDVLKADFKDFLPNVMVDLQFSILAKAQGVPLVSIARPKLWLQALVQGEGLYQDFLFRKTVHTSKSVEHAPWGFDVYSDIVRGVLGDRFLNMSGEELLAGKFDVDFFEGVRSGVAPPSWSESDLYRSKVEEREFVKRPLVLYRRLQKNLAKAERALVKERRALNKIRKSRSFRGARMLALSVRKPFWNLFLLPLRLVKLLARGR